MLARVTRAARCQCRCYSTTPSTIKAALASETADPGLLTINAWVRSCRRQKNVAFAVLNDGSNVAGIQAVLPKGLETG